MPDSSIGGFFKKGMAERVGAVRDFAGLTDEEVRTLHTGGITPDDADRMIENAMGTLALPLGVATNFRINGRDYLIPMAIEEPSVIAAASKGAKDARILGGFTAIADESVSIGQIQVLGASQSATAGVEAAAGKILEAANSQSSTLSGMNKGAKKVTCRNIKTDSGEMLIVEIAVDVADAMGANVINSMCEAAAPIVEEATGGRVLLRILSNYSTSRMAQADAVFDSDAVGGPDVVDAIVEAYQFAKHDVYRAVTHNKGVMNGIAAVANATGQDGRAIEAAAGAYAARNGAYTSLTEWSKDGKGNLTGRLRLPLSVGTVGGITGVHPTVKTCIKILGVRSACELGCVMAAVGLGQNYSAMRALCTEGIQKGHMRLHARNVAAAAGASSDKINEIAGEMIKTGEISGEAAKKLLKRV